MRKTHGVAGSYQRANIGPAVCKQQLQVVVTHLPAANDPLNNELRIGAHGDGGTGLGASGELGKEGQSTDHPHGYWGLEREAPSAIGRMDGDVVTELLPDSRTNASQVVRASAGNRRRRNYREVEVIKAATES